jgi:hypothetical protein
MEVNMFGKVLIGIGLFFILLGFIFIVGTKINWFGRLPGDILIQKKNFTLYFPVSTSIIISVILSVLFWIITRRIK